MLKLRRCTSRTRCKLCSKFTIIKPEQRQLTSLWYPENINLFKVNSSNTRNSCGIYSKLRKKAPDIGQECRSAIHIVKFNVFLEFPLPTLNMHFFPGYMR